MGIVDSGEENNSSVVLVCMQKRLFTNKLSPHQLTSFGVEMLPVC